MKNLTLLIILFLSISVFGQGKSQVIPITDDLLTYLDQRSDYDLIRINIRLKDQFNSQSIERQLVFLDRDQKRELVKQELKYFSRNAQADLVHYLENKLSDNEAEILHRFWIANVITCLAREEDTGFIDLFIVTAAWRKRIYWVFWSSRFSKHCIYCIGITTKLPS